MVNLQQQLEDAQKRIIELSVVIEELSIERDCLKREVFRVEDIVREREKEFLRKIDDGLREKEYLEVEIYEGVREREDLVKKIDVGFRENEGLLKDIENFKDTLSRGLGIIGLIKERLMRVNEGFGEKKLDFRVDHEGGNMEGYVSNFEGKSDKCLGMGDFLEELDFVSRVAKRVEEKLVDYGEKEDLLKEIESYKWRNLKELKESLEVVGIIEDSLRGVNECLDENNLEPWVDKKCNDFKQVLNLEEKLEEGLLFKKLVLVSRMTKMNRDKINVHLEKMEREKRELERSIMSLTEENRDANALLRIALIEKEAVEKSVSKLKGNNTEQRRVPLLHYAERGLQRVGFGFIIGGTSNEQYEEEKKNDDQILDSSTDVNKDCESEGFSLASTVEKTMKNLRFENNQLRRDIENSRSETERLQNLTEKQAIRISELTVYVKELEDRERILTQNVEELLVEIKATEEEVERWRKACELEVEAGKHVAKEHNYLVAIMEQELEKTRIALKVSDKKLQLKEEVAAAAIAAQSAAERSLRLADSRAAGYQQRIEELTKQVEEVESRHKINRHTMRQMCWPWHALSSASVTTIRAPNLDVRRTLPEMQALFR
ncbi:hypothetical protein RDABS01_012192 [Bienertia sinuspersici]